MNDDPEHQSPQTAKASNRRLAMAFHKGYTLLPQTLPSETWNSSRYLLWLHTSVWWPIHQSAHSLVALVRWKPRQASVTPGQTTFDPNEKVLWLVHFQAEENSKADEADKAKFGKVHHNDPYKNKKKELRVEGFTFAFMERYRIKPSLKEYQDRFGQTLFLTGNTCLPQK